MEEGTIFTLIKGQWQEYQRKKIEEATRPLPTILVAVHDREQALFALIKQQGIQMLSDMQGDVEKKSFQTKAGSFYQEIAQQMQTYKERYKPGGIILASPAFFKEEVMKAIPEKERKGLVLATVSSVTKQALTELLRRQEVQGVLKEDMLTKEAHEVARILGEISKGGKGIYGKDEVDKACKSGAVEMLIITDSKILQARQDASIDDLIRMMKTVESMNGKVLIIHGDSDAGMQADGLGGIIASLRYVV